MMAVLDRCPTAASLADECNNYPLHFMCANKSVSPELLAPLLKLCPKSATIKNGDGELPLHICKKFSAPDAAIHAIALSLSGESQKEKDTPETNQNA